MRNGRDELNVWTPEVVVAAAVGGTLVQSNCSRDTSDILDPPVPRISLHPIKVIFDARQQFPSPSDSTPSSAHVFVCRSILAFVGRLFPHHPRQYRGPAEQRDGAPDRPAPWGK